MCRDDPGPDFKPPRPSRFENAPEPLMRTLTVVRYVVAGLAVAVFVVWCVFAFASFGSL